AGGPVAARRDADPAGHRRHRADPRHGGRCQCADLRAHPRGGAQRPFDAVLARGRLHSRLRHDPRQPRDDAGRRHPALHFRLRSGEGVCRHPQHRRAHVAVLGDPGDPAADRLVAAALEAEGNSAMRPLIVIRRTPTIDFMRWHRLGMAFSALLGIASIVLFLAIGLNYGIDFKGGMLIEARVTGGPADLAAMRAKIDALKIGEASLQGFGSPSDVLIRLPQQPGGDKGQEKAIAEVKSALGPGVGAELIRAGVWATVLALAAIMVYIWFRFEWQFGVGATISTIHDVVTTVGLFAIFRLEFNLTTLAAILTIAGYSINDTVVIYDRVRESMRKHRSMGLRELINLALNETLSRTILTVSTVALAVLALLIFGGEVLRGFSIAMLWGIVVGTYSSLFIAAPLLYYIQPNRRASAREGGAPATERASR